VLFLKVKPFSVQLYTMYEGNTKIVSDSFDGYKRVDWLRVVLHLALGLDSDHE